MPIIKSAIKQMRQNQTRRKRNEITKRQYRLLVKEFLILVHDKKMDEAKKLFPQVQKAIDMAAKKNILAKNNAARKKSRLSKLINTEAKAPVKEATPKKSEEKDS